MGAAIFSSRFAWLFCRHIAVEKLARQTGLGGPRLSRPMIRSRPRGLRATPPSIAEFPDHEVFVIRHMTYADCSGIRAVDLESVALVGPDCSGCFEQDLKMYLLDACLGMGKKLLDESICDSFTSAVFPHVNREDV